MNNLVGKKIAHYQITALLGQGRIGTVYQATDLENQAPVALKVMPLHLTQKQEFRRRFLEEVQAIPRLDHPSIIKVYEAGVDTDQDILYMTMEYVTTRTLTAYLQQLKWQDKIIRLGEAIFIGAQIAEALDYAHQKGVLHRDIRPNVILFKTDESSRLIGGIPRRAVLSDFSLVTLLEAEEEPFAPALPYMSPEQCLHTAMDGRSDLYSLGILLYELVTGQQPFTITLLADAVRLHPYHPPKPPRQIRPDLPMQVESVIMKAIAKKPEDRYQTGEEMAKALQQVATILPDSLTAVTADEEIRSIQTEYESPAQLARSSAIQWGSGDDRVIITQDVPHGLNRRIITIGRDETNDITLPDMSVTRRHVQLEQTPTGWQVRDLGSKNGTFIDGTPLLPDIPSEWLGHQTLRIGSYFLQLQEGNGHHKASPFTVNVTPDEIDIVPGQRKELQVILTNRSAATEDYEIKIERLPASWITLPESPLQLAPNQQTTLIIRVHPPLSRDTTPGTSRYLLVVNTMSAAQEKIAVPGTLHVKSAEDIFSIALHPTTIHQKGMCQLSIHNEGVADQLYTINGQDPNGSLRFGEWRVKEEAPPTAASSGIRSKLRLPSGSQQGKKSPSRATGYLRRIPFIRRILTAPRFFVDRLLAGPRFMLNRVLPGLGNMLSVSTVTRKTQNMQLGKKQEETAAAKPEAPVKEEPVIPARRDMYEVIFPDELHTQTEVASGERHIVNLSIAARKRPWFGRQNQTIPFELSVTTPNKKHQTVTGQLDVKPRIRTRISSGVVIFLLLILCLGGTAAYAAFFNETLSAVLFAPSDLDGDGSTNIAEVYIHKTDPNVADSDGDNLPDGEEIDRGLDPKNPDTDKDGILDGQEIEFSTNPLAFDTDGDGLSDSLELQVFHTDPLIPNEAPTWVPPTPVPTATPIPLPTPIPTQTPTPTPSIVQTIFSSEADRDGYIGQDINAGMIVISDGSIIQVGEGDIEDQQYKGFLSFNTADIPDDALIQSAQLRINQNSVTGQPASLGQIHVDIGPENGFSNNPALELTDFESATALVNTLTLNTTASVDNWLEASFNATSLNAINQRGITQFRLYFTLPNNNNEVADWIRFHSSNHIDDDLHPQLIVVYQVP